MALVGENYGETLPYENFTTVISINVCKFKIKKLVKLT